MTLRELSAAFGLTHPDSLCSLIRRADRALLAPVRSVTRSRRSANGSSKDPKPGPEPAKPRLERGRFLPPRKSRRRADRLTATCRSWTLDNPLVALGADTCSAVPAPRS